MFLYKKELHENKFRWKFDGLDLIQTSYSQCLQDMWVIATSDVLYGGTFLEIGADQGQFISNTFLLESKFNWRGVSVDINPGSKASFDATGRKSKFILGNALTVDYTSVLEDLCPDHRVSYLQLDIEPNINTLRCLEALPLNDFRFTAITFETDYYDTNTPKQQNDYVRSQSRKILTDLGYVLVAGNICNLTPEFPMEDWYLDGKWLWHKWIEKFQRDSDDPIPAHVYMGLE